MSKYGGVPVGSKYGGVPVEQPEITPPRTIEEARQQFDPNQEFNPLGDSLEWLEGIVQPVASMASGMAAAPVSQIGGGIQMYMNPSDPMAGPNARDRIASALTYQPDNPVAQSIMRQYGETLAPVAEYMDKARLGDEALERGMPEWVARNAEAIPEYGGALLASMGLLRPQPRKPLITDPKTGDLVQSMSRDRFNVMGTSNQSARQIKPTVKQRFSDAGKLVSDKPAARAVKSGWSDKSVRWVNAQSKATREKLREMVDIADEYFHSMEAERLPSDVIGKSATDRISLVNGIRRRAGSAMNVIAEGQLARTRVDLGALRSGLNTQIRKLGGSIGDDGIKFGPKSKLYKQGGDQQALVDLYDKLNALGRAPTGKEAHDLKQWIDTYIDAYTKSPTAPTGGAITQASQKVLEGARREVNSVLRQTSKPYAKANDIYSETSRALNGLQKGAGNIDMFGPSAPESVGQVMRRLLSNAQSRTKIKDSINEVGKLADRYSKGQLPYENYTPHYRFLSEMEKNFGAFKEESLKGNIGQVVRGAIENPSALGIGREAANMTARQLKRAVTSRDNQLATMKELLYRGGD